jgi:hypothetical protein
LGDVKERWEEVFIGLQHLQRSRKGYDVGDTACGSKYGGGEEIVRVEEPSTSNWFIPMSHCHPRSRPEQPSNTDSVGFPPLPRIGAEPAGS